MRQAGPWFDVVAIGPGGQVRAARLHATNAEEATRAAQRGGLRVLDVVPASSASHAKSWLSAVANPPRLTAFKGPSRLDVGSFAHELAALLDAGLGIIESLNTLEAKEASPSQRAILHRLAQTVTEGLPLSHALAEEGDAFPELLTAAVAAAEHTGDLPTSLRRFAENQAALRTLRSRFIGAAIYPAVLLAVGSVVVMFLLGFVVPKFAQLIERAPHEVPLASRLLLNWGTTLAGHPWLFGASAFVLAAAAAAIAVRGHRTGWRMSGMQRLWVIGPLIRQFRQAQFYRTAAMLVGGGIPALRALTMCGALLTPEDQRALAGAMTSISEGQSIGTAMAASGVADVVAERMLVVAGRTGNLAEALGRIAAFQENHLERAIDVATRLIEPALMIFIGLVIGGIVVLMYMPIFELAAGLQ
jgi:general secretion pathway protein F